MSLAGRYDTQCLFGDETLSTRYAVAYKGCRVESQAFVRTRRPIDRVADYFMTWRNRDRMRKEERRAIERDAVFGAAPTQYLLTNPYAEQPTTSTNPLAVE